jgi:hypothetical protein
MREFRNQPGGDVPEQESIDSVWHPRDDKLTSLLACVGPIGPVVPSETAGFSPRAYADRLNTSDP